MKQKLKLEIGCRVVVQSVPKTYNQRLVGNEGVVKQIGQSVNTFRSGWKDRPNDVAIADLKDSVDARHGYLLWINRKYIRVVQAAPEESK